MAPPEMIQPGRSDVRGYVDSSRPGRTTLDALSDALGETSKVLGYYADKEHKKNVEEAYDLLSSPLLTDAEIDEIEKDHRSPLVHLRAQNARGGLLVQERWQDIETEVSSAKDPVEARRILRERQQEILTQADDPAIQAGIRQRFADLAPDVLTKAAKRREEAIKIEERLTVSQDLQAALEAGPTAFTEIWAGHVYDSQVAGRDMDEFHSDAAQTLLNQWLSGDDGKRDNPDTPRVLEALDTILASGHVVDPKQKAKYVDVRETIETAEEQRLGSLDEIDESIAAANHANWQKKASAWVVANPNQPLDPDIARNLLASARTGAESRAVSSFIQKTHEDPKVPGVIGTKEYDEARGVLKASTQNVEGQIDATSLDLFDRAARELPPSLKSDPKELRTTLGELARQAQEQSRLTKDRQAEQDAQYETELTELQAQLEGTTLPTLRKQVEDSIKGLARARAKTTAKQYKADVNSMLENIGYAPDYLDTLPE